MAFNLRSGNKSSFKSMGSSPMKNEEVTRTQEDADVQPVREEAEPRVMDANEFMKMVETRDEAERMNEANRIFLENRDPNFIGPQQQILPGEDEHFAKGEDYIVDDGGEKVIQDEDGSFRPGDDGEYNPEFNRNKVDLLESQVDDYLENPMEKGAARAYEIGDEVNAANTQVPFVQAEELANIDPLRHTLAAMYTSEKVGMIPTNIMGIMHELNSKNTPREHREDILNNLIGSIVGSVPFTSTKKKEKLVQKLWEKGLLFSGRPKETAKEKQERNFEEIHRDQKTDELMNQAVNEAVEETKKLSHGL